MKALSKTEREQRDDICTRLRDGWSSLEDAYEQVSSAIGDFNTERERYNEIVNEAQGFAEDIASQIEGYMDERSDKWREGDRGQEYEAWLSVWQNDLAFDEVEELEEPGMPDGGDLADELENAQEAPE